MPVAAAARFRPWRRHLPAVGALVEQGRAFHVAYASSSMAGIRAVVL
jgi:hypothetical protein